MSASSHESHPSSYERSYIFDAESGAEMARLLTQDRLANRMMGGLFPERSTMEGIEHILDIGCGPGGWAQEVAFAYPDIRVTGIDISRAMIAYAQQQARIQHLSNLTFQVMDATQPLEFAEGTFDLVNGRAMSSFLSPATWPVLIQEARRVLHPGGAIRLTEGEWGFANTPAYERYCWLLNQAMARAGKSFSPNGVHYGITPMLTRFLRQAGCEHIESRAYVGEYSAGTEANHSFYQDYRAAFVLVQPFLVHTGVISQEEVERLYEEAMSEMRSEEFCAVSFGIIAWGVKPAHAG